MDICVNDPQHMLTLVAIFFFVAMPLVFLVSEPLRKHLSKRWGVKIDPSPLRGWDIDETTLASGQKLNQSIRTRVFFAFICVYSCIMFTAGGFVLIYIISSGCYAMVTR